MNEELRAVVDEELMEDDEALLYVDLRRMIEMREDVRRLVEMKESFDERCSQMSGHERYMAEFAPVFAKTEFDQLPPNRIWDHAIELKPGAEPFNSKIYPLSRDQLKELDRFIEEHIKSGRIRVSKSPYASPFFFVKKKDGSLRPVQDYRKLNDITIRN